MRESTAETEALGRVQSEHDQTEPGHVRRRGEDKGTRGQGVSQEARN